MRRRDYSGEEVRDIFAAYRTLKVALIRHAAVFAARQRAINYQFLMPAAACRAYTACFWGARFR